MRVLVCGGRNYSDRRAVYSALEDIAHRLPVGAVITGSAPGADTLALAWAAGHGIPRIRFPAEWHGHGRAAGPIRNQRMIDEGQPDLVIAFPGGAGTADMVRRARHAGVCVWMVE